MKILPLLFTRKKTGKEPFFLPKPPHLTHSLKNRKKIFFLILILLLFGAVFFSLCLGAVPVSFVTVLRVLSGAERGTTASNILLLARLPRTCGCLLAGMALALSGTIIQSVLTNPLAAPNIIGVNAGAGFAVALCSALAPSAAAAGPFAAFIGALINVLLVLTIAERTGASRITLVLAGVAVSSLFNAGIDAIVTFVPEALNGYSDFRIGGLSNLSMSRIIPAAAVILPAALLVFSLAGEMDLLLLGMDTAKSLGLRAGRMRILLLALASALAGAAVSFAGLIGFVGLIIPHIMRRLLGEQSLPLLAASALGGAFFLTFADLLSRLLFRPYELPVGILLSVIGAPFFIWLLLHQRGGRIHD